MVVTYSHLNKMNFVLSSIRGFSSHGSDHKRVLLQDANCPTDVTGSLTLPGIFQAKYVKSMAVDVLSSCVFSSSATMQL